MLTLGASVSPPGVLEGRFRHNMDSLCEAEAVDKETFLFASNNACKELALERAAHIYTQYHAERARWAWMANPLPRTFERWCSPYYPSSSHTLPAGLMSKKRSLTARFKSICPRGSRAPNHRWILRRCSIGGTS